jgi:hypothetical protein
MARGRKTALTIRLTPAERLTLLTWQRATTIAAGVARHARLLLLVADGMTITEAAAMVGLSRRHSYKWLRRFMAQNQHLNHEPQTAWNILLINELWRSDFLGHRERLFGVR